MDANAGKEMVGTVELGLLGAFRLSIDGRPINIFTKKNRGLLAILALSPGRQATRERLCGLLWGDRGEEQARSCLRQSLAVLRKELGDAETSIIQTRDDLVMLQPIRTDVLQLLTISNSATAAEIRAAVDHCQGELLADTVIRDETFGTWLESERRRANDRLTALLERLCDLEGGQAAVAVARRLVDLDPLREASHRALMRAYHQVGEMGLAHRQFEECRRLLRDELGIEAAAATMEVYREITRTVGSSGKSHSIIAAPPAAQPASGTRPLIAVLPLTPLMADTSLRYLADGISVDLTMEISRHHALEVIASDSAFRFRSSADSPQTIGLLLGATHIVTGGLDSIEGGLSLAIQVSDVLSGKPIWTERFVFAARDLFATLHDLTASIAGIVEGRIAADGARNVSSRPIANWTAYENYLKGRDLSVRYLDEEAVPYLDRAIELDPRLAQAHAWRAMAYVGRYHQDHLRHWLDVSETSARQALLLDPADTRGYHAMGLTKLWQRRYSEAGEQYDAGLKLNPADMLLNYDKANWLTYTGKPGEGLARIDEQRLRDPYPPVYVHQIRGFALFQLKRYEEAIIAFEKISTDHYWQHCWLAAAYASIGCLNDAKREMKETLRLKPEFSISWVRPTLGFEAVELCAEVLRGLRHAGAPE